MNTLSWFLYFADVFSSLGVFLGIGGATFIIIWWVVATVMAGQGETKIPKWWLWGWVVPPLCFLLAILIPSKNTIYAIAASELGQQAVESRLGNKAMLAIEQWIDQQIQKKESK